MTVIHVERFTDSIHRMNTAFCSCVVAIALVIFQFQHAACTPLNTRPAVVDLAKNNESKLYAPEDYRLNDEVWPTHYDIEITPYFAAESNKSAFTFDGVATVSVTARKNGVASIKLHKSHMNVISWSVLRISNSHPVPQLNQTYDEETEMITLWLGETLLQNVEYLVTFHYVGLMEDNMRGFYRTYYNTTKEQVWLGSTQFEQTDARRAFPCFDEPKFKTTFTLKINHNPLEHKVYSNTPIVSNVDLGNNRTLTTFGITPKMSTYLLAFIVARYDPSGQDVLQVLARPEALNQTDYGVREGLKLLQALGRWIDYPFDEVPEITRMFMAAVPDFAAGAMENWGLITYRESSLLYVPEDATSLQQQRIATIIAHELAHQWFGNLLTCEWWDVTWLNEGFASYLEYYGTALVEPSWELDQQFVVEKLQSAMQLDSLPSVHPMTHPVYTQHEAAAMFDAISYNKGAVVLRMMEHFLSNAVFKTALREYVKVQAYKATRPEDLFVVLDRHNPSARAHMEPWTTQSGFPLVTVTGTEEGFTLTQKRFLANGTDHNDLTLWPLPITYATKSDEFANTKPTFVATESHNISVPDASTVQYFILNNQQLGYYRVNYEANLWGKISKALRSEDFGGIHVLNRAQIVDDLFNLAAAGIVSYGTALNILDYLREESEYLPWLAAANGLYALSQRIHQEDEHVFTNHILDIFAKVYERVKFQTPTSSERRVHTYLRRVVLDWACRHGHEGCTNSAIKEFARFRSNPSVKVHPDLRQVVYCEGVRQGSTEQFDFLLELYNTTNVATEQQLALQGLSCASEDALVHKFMTFVNSPNVRKHDKNTALTLLLNNPYTIAPATSYLVENSEALAELYDGPKYVVLALRTILQRTKDAAVRETIKQFADAHVDEIGKEGYDIISAALETFDKNQQFTVNHRDDILDFLKQKAENGATSPVVFSMTLAFSLALVALGR